jgi:hypothetical protein
VNITTRRIQRRLSDVQHGVAVEALERADRHPIRLFGGFVFVIDCFAVISLPRRPAQEQSRGALGSEPEDVLGRPARDARERRRIGRLFRLANLPLNGVVAVVLVPVARREVHRVDSS